MGLACRLVHSIPGRARIRLETRDALDRYADALHASLRDRSGVRDVRFNPGCRSAVIQYDPRSVTDRDLLDWLRQTSIDHLKESQRRLRRAGSSDAGPNGGGLISRLSENLRRGASSLLHRAEAALSPQEQSPAAAGARTSPHPTPAASTNGKRPVLARQRDDPAPRWHALSPDDVLARWESSGERGLTSAGVGERLARFGPNVLEEPDGRSRWSIFLEQFQSLPVALLFGSAAVSIATGGIADAIAVLGVVGINAVIGHVTETNAEDTIAHILDAGHPQAAVLRDGERAAVPSEDVVPGDVLLLSPGVCLAADARLLWAERLTIDESTLTGESMPVLKQTAALGDAKVPLREHTNMAYRGTVVTGGNGRAVVVGTGADTEVGKIQSMVSQARSPETPVQRQLRELGFKLGIASGAVCAGVFGIGLARGIAMLEMFKTASSLAVAAVPEGLPMVATTTLALGVRRMRGLNVLVRNLDAVETIGSVQAFCLDKTGTITLNRMSVARLYLDTEIYDIDDRGIYARGDQDAALQRDELRLLQEAVVLCNETALSDEEGEPKLSGSPTETSLVRMALDAGLDVRSLRSRYPTLKTEYRTEDRRYMATLHRHPEGGRVLHVKGRPGEVLRLCRWQMRGGRRVELSDSDRERIKTENERMAGDALRVLGVASARGERLEGSSGAELTWLGLAGIVDPVREGIADLIQVFHGAGMKTIMVTGDQSATAYAIGKQLNLSGNERLDILDSSDLENIDPDVLKSLSREVDVFSAVSPSHKLEIVQALQRGGMVVAMTGDGINDGPALKAADVGIAMGGDDGAEVARRTADIILEDNDLRTIITAVRQGRTIYANTRNSILYLLSTNMSEILVTFGSVAAGVGRPLTPMQLLWLNLVSDIFPVLALAVQPPEDDMLDRPPRDPGQPFLHREDLQRIARESGFIGLGTMASYAWGLSRYGPGPQASTMAFMSLTAAQLLHLFTARSESHSVFSPQRPASNPLLAGAFIGGLALQALTAFVPGLRKLLGIAPVGPLGMLVATFGAVGPFVVNEAFKAAARRPAEVTPSLLDRPLQALALPAPQE